MSSRGTDVTLLPGGSRGTGNPVPAAAHLPRSDRDRRHPNPLGLFYLTELLAPTNSGYGPYAYGLSAFSNVLTSFGGGPGQIGLHGTADAASIGHSVSHGCIRLTNTDITTLAKLLPLGTPVHIT